MPEQNNTNFTASSMPQHAIWPPAPNTAGAAPNQIPYLPFLFLYNRVSGNISDVREGVLGLRPDGLGINGKSQVRQEICMPIMILLALCCMPIALVASMLFRIAFLQPTETFIPSADITEIVLEPRTLRAGIAFSALNYKGKTLPFCLCFQLAPDSFPVFALWAMHVASNKTFEGRLKSGTNRATWIIFGILIALLVAIFAFAIGYSRWH